jgi:hypothetical protein
MKNCIANGMHSVSCGVYFQGLKSSVQAENCLVTGRALLGSFAAASRENFAKEIASAAKLLQ